MRQNRSVCGEKDLSLQQRLNWPTHQNPARGSVINSQIGPDESVYALKISHSLIYWK